MDWAGIGQVNSLSTTFSTRKTQMKAAKKFMAVFLLAMLFISVTMAVGFSDDTGNKYDTWENGINNSRWSSEDLAAGGSHSTTFSTSTTYQAEGSYSLFADAGTDGDGEANFYSMADIQVGESYGTWHLSKNIAGNSYQGYGIVKTSTGDRQEISTGNGKVFLRGGCFGNADLVSGLSSDTWYYLKLTIHEASKIGAYAYDTNGNLMQGGNYSCGDDLTTYDAVTVAVTEYDSSDVDSYYDNTVYSSVDSSSGGSNETDTPPSITGVNTVGSLARGSSYNVTVNVTDDNSVTDVTIYNVSENGTILHNNLSMFGINSTWYLEQAIDVSLAKVYHNFTVKAVDSVGQQDNTTFSVLTGYNPTVYRYYDHGFNNTELIESDDYQQDLEVWGNISDNRTQQIEIYTVAKNDGGTVAMNETWDISGSTLDGTKALDVSGADFNVTYTFKAKFIDSKFFGQNLTMNHYVRNQWDNGTTFRVDRVGYTEHETEATQFSLITGISDAITGAISTLVDAMLSPLETIENILSGIIDAIYNILIQVYALIVNSFNLIIGAFKAWININAYEWNNWALTVTATPASLDNNNTFTYYNYSGNNSASAEDANVTVLDMITGNLEYNVTYTAAEWREENDKTLGNLQKRVIARQYTAEEQDNTTEAWINTTRDYKKITTADTIYEFTVPSWGGSTDYIEFNNDTQPYNSSGSFYASFTGGLGDDEGSIYMELNKSLLAEDEKEYLVFNASEQGGDSPQDGFRLVIESDADSVDVKVPGNGDNRLIALEEVNDSYYNVSGSLLEFNDSIAREVNISLRLKGFGDGVEPAYFNLTGYKTSMRDATAENAVDIYEYYIDFSDAPDGISQGMMLIVSFIAIIGGIISWILNLLPTSIKDLITGFFDTIVGIVEAINYWFGMIVTFINVVFVKGAKYVKWGIIGYGVIKGIHYLEVLQDDRRSMVDSIHYIGRDLERTLKNAIELAETAVSVSVDIYRLIVDLIRSLIGIIRG